MHNYLGHSIVARLGSAYNRCVVSDEVQITAVVGLALERHVHLDIKYKCTTTPASADP